MDAFLERGFKAVERGYAWGLNLALRFRLVVWALFFASLVAAGWLAVAIPKGFFPIEDTGLANVATEGPRDASFEAMVELQGRVARIIQANPYVASRGLQRRRGRAVQPVDQPGAHVRRAEAARNERPPVRR